MSRLEIIFVCFFLESFFLAMEESCCSFAIHKCHNNPNNDITAYLHSPLYRCLFLWSFSPPTGSLDMFILPAAIYLKIMPDSAPLRKPAMAILVFGVAVMVAVVTESVLSFTGGGRR